MLVMKIVLWVHYSLNNNMMMSYLNPASCREKNSGKFLKISLLPSPVSLSQLVVGLYRLSSVSPRLAISSPSRARQGVSGCVCLVQVSSISRKSRISLGRRISAHPGASSASAILFFIRIG
jgi:hypothetical protein